MTGCAAPNCTNRPEKGYRMFKIPRNPERRKEWIKSWKGNGIWKPTYHGALCEVHFETSQFELHRADGLKKLKPNAVPTIFDLSEPVRMKRKRVSTLQYEDYSGEITKTEHSDIWEGNSGSESGSCSRIEEIALKELDELYYSNILHEVKREACSDYSDVGDSTPYKPQCVSYTETGSAASRGVAKENNFKNQSGNQVNALKKVQKKRKKTMGTASKEDCNDTPVSSSSSRRPLRKSARLSLERWRKVCGVMNRRKSLIQPESDRNEEDTNSNSKQMHCFICNTLVMHKKCIYLENLTKTGKENMCSVLSRLVRAINVPVNEDDAICHLCADFINYIDYVQIEIQIIKKSIENCVKKKHVLKENTNMNLANGVNCLFDQFLRDGSGLEKENVIVANSIFNSITKSSPTKTVTKCIFDEPDTVTDNQSLAKEVLDTSECGSLTDGHNQDVPSDDQNRSTNVQPVTCRICSFETVHQSVMVYHLRRHIQEEFSCDFCGINIPPVQNLDTDFHLSQTIKNSQPVSCDVTESENCDISVSENENSVNADVAIDVPNDSMIVEGIDYVSQDSIDSEAEMHNGIELQQDFGEVETNMVENEPIVSLEIDELDNIVSVNELDEEFSSVCVASSEFIDYNELSGRSSENSNVVS